MAKSGQTYCICGKPITMRNDEHDSIILEIIGEKNNGTQFFHSIDCALIYKRLEGLFGKVFHDQSN